MKKILIFTLVSLLIGLTCAYATNHPASENIVEIGRFRGARGITPPTEVIKVRYALDPPTGAASIAGNINSGDVLVWDMTSKDGYTISEAEVDHSLSYCGVAVTDITTTDNANVRGDGVNIGYMAVRGYCLAKVSSTATPGDALILDVQTNSGAFTTSKVGYTGGATPVTHDIGLCLESPSSTGLAPVWLW